jgi:hypothetical protein
MSDVNIKDLIKELGVLKTENEQIKQELKEKHTKWVNAVKVASDYFDDIEKLKQERDKLINAIKIEPELPDKMPDEMYLKLKEIINNKDEVEFWFRALVRATKKGILKTALAYKR